LKRKNNFADSSFEIKLKMKHTRRFIIGIIATCCWLACTTQTEVQPEPQGKRFFPLAVGNFFVFDIEQTLYTSGPVGVTTQFQRKWYVADLFENQENENVYILYEYTRTTPQENWTYIKTRNAILSDYHLLLSDEAISFQKLLFPLRQGTRWNVNKFNTLPEKIITLTKLPLQKTVNTVVYTQVAEIEYTNEEDRIIGNDIEKEWYALDVGLIERYLENITYCSNTPACLGQQIIQSGSIVSEKLNSYGNEL